MVFFALTRNGYDELVNLIGVAPRLLWVNENVLTADEIKSLREAGIELTCFTYTIDPGNHEEIEEAVSTIQLHHHRHVVWVEVALADR